jgi:hypothetical protein
MNYSFVDKYSSNDFIPKNPSNLYNNYKQNDYVPNNYYWSGYQQNTNNWATEGSIQKTMMKGIYEPTPVGELFFSQENIRRLQKMIKYEVFVRTNGKYKLEVDQNETDLLVVMRDVMISCADNTPYKVVHQVKTLNHRVVERIVPDMISMIKQDDDYVKQLDKPIDPIPLPVCMSSRGRLQLPSVTTTFYYKK